MFLQNPFRGAFGLDIGDLSIKLVQLSKSWRIGYRPNFGWQEFYKIQELRSIKLPPGYIVGGEIVEMESLRKKLLHLLGKDGGLKPINCPWVVADLPEPKTFLKLIEVNSSPQELVEDDIYFHAKKHLPFDLTEAYLDWQIINPDQKETVTKILLGAVPKQISDSYTHLFESAGLIPISLEIEALSIARSAITATKEYAGEARAILDLGATRSSLIVYDKNTVQFSTDINFSGELLTTAISQGLKLDREEAEKLKIKNGITYDEKYPKYLKLVAKHVETLTADIKQSLMFYKNHFPNANPVTHITMCGGVAQTKKLGGIISRQIKITASPGNMWKNLFNPKYGEKEKAQGLSWSSAIGLAIRASQNPF